jgi:hypothetical protein
MSPYTFMCYEMLKLAAEEPDVTSEEAMDAARQLRRLHKSKQTKGQLLRGAVSGAAILPVFAQGANIIKGKVPHLPSGGLNYNKLGREVAGDALRGAAIGSLLPMARQHMNTEAEKEKLKRYLGTSEVGPTRSKVRRVLGVG